MATVGGLSNGASNSVSMYGASIKGYGGLASGLDTDSMIEGMTMGTRTKIQDALKKKQNFQWEMEAYRSVSDPLIAFSNKYLNISSSSSPYRASFFDKTMVTAHGINSKYLTASGASPSLDNMKILGIKQKAKDSSLVTNKNTSIKMMNTGGVNFSDKIDVSKLEGGQMTLKLGDYSYTLNMNSGDDLFGAGDPPTNNKTDFTTAEATKNTINALLRDTKIVGLPDGSPAKYLSDEIKLDYDGKNFSLKRTDPNSKLSLDLIGGTEGALKAMGFMDGEKAIIGDGRIPHGADGLAGVYKDVSGDALKKSYTFAEYMDGKTMTFNYNGSSKRITLPSKAEIEKSIADGGWTSNLADPVAANKESMKAMASYINGELDKAFGSGKISVDLLKDSGGNVILDSNNNPSLSFATPDPSSVLRITDADAGIMGKKGVLGIDYSTTNRLSMETPISESGMSPFGGSFPPGFGEYTIVDDGTGRGKKVYTVTDFNDADGNLFININGKEIPPKTDALGNPIPRLKVDSNMRQILTVINDSDAGVKMSYNETADRITMLSTNRGEAGDIDISTAGGKMPDPNNPGSMIDDPNQKNFIHLLIGTTNADHTYIKGQDAIMTVQYEGNVETDIKRDSNSFNLDGTTFTLTDTFGYKEGLVDTAGVDVTTPLFDVHGRPIKEQVKISSDGLSTIPPLYDANNNLIPPPAGSTPDSILYNYHTPIAGTEGVTFTSAVDTEKAVKVIGEMIEDYNKMADHINKLVSTKPDRDYEPLTDDEKAQLNADQIKMLEDKAKEGILFNDPLLSSLSDKMRSVFSGVTDIGTLSDMGLGLSNNWKDNGKVNFDPEKFKNALLKDPEQLKKLFTEPPTKDAQGQIVKSGGISVRLKAITDDFAGINSYTKGSLIQKAGSTSSSLSLLDNAIQKQMDSIDKTVKELKRKLQTEVDRYTKQFSSLEQLISQMNSQSSWLAQATGG